MRRRPILTVCRRFAASLLLGAVVSGCAVGRAIQRDYNNTVYGTADAENYARIVRSWVNSDVNRLIQAWGPPSSQYTMPNGDVMYTWLRVGGTLVTASYDQYIDAIRARSVTYWCKTTFTTDATHVIRRALSEGNACRSHK